MTMMIGLLACLVAATAAGSSEPLFELVGEKRCATIVLAADAEESSQLAATEITNYVHRLAGKSQPIVSRNRTFEQSEHSNNFRLLIGTLAKFPGEVPAEARACRPEADPRRAVSGATVNEEE